MLLRKTSSIQEEALSPHGKVKKGTYKNAEKGGKVGGPIKGGREL